MAGNLLKVLFGFYPSCWFSPGGKEKMFAGTCRELTNLGVKVHQLDPWDWARHPGGAMIAVAAAGLTALTVQAADDYVFALCRGPAHCRRPARHGYCTRPEGELLAANTEPCPPEEHRAAEGDPHRSGGEQQDGAEHQQQHHRTDQVARSLHGRPPAGLPHSASPICAGPAKKPDLVT